MKIFSTRYSCRNFKDKDIEAQDLRKILEVARFSPSSLGLEPWKFLVVQDKIQKSQISLIANHQAHLKSAAALIIIVSRLDFEDYFEDKLRQRKMSEVEFQKRVRLYKPFLSSMDKKAKLAYSREQAHIALASILYGANSLGIASCTIGGFDRDKLNEYLKLDTDKAQATLIVALGFAADEGVPDKARFTLDELVEFL
ncbi:nitroreductase family protein [Campylobacter sp.]|uniref:nitroreductase family protein n=1 Tax=Campylobacter sp. TaxID=205 RepID=UPI0026DBC48C|nr:nitroreductase family protein [Campylobacter sp.]MDO4674117.1 nitroreductase family protein [Campylobacter sp.]